MAVVFGLLIVLILHCYWHLYHCYSGVCPWNYVAHIVVAAAAARGVAAGVGVLEWMLVRTQPVILQNCHSWLHLCYCSKMNCSSLMTEMLLNSHVVVAVAAVVCSRVIKER